MRKNLCFGSSSSSSVIPKCMAASPTHSTVDGVLYNTAIVTACRVVDTIICTIVSTKCTSVTTAYYRHARHPEGPSALQSPSCFYSLSSTRDFYSLSSTRDKLSVCGGTLLYTHPAAPCLQSNNPRLINFISFYLTLT